MHQLKLLEHMNRGEESFLLLRQLWRQLTGEEPVNAAYTWKRNSLDVGYRLISLAFVFISLITGCIFVVIMRRKGFSYSSMNLQILILALVIIFGLGTGIVIKLIKHLQNARSAFGTAIEDLADALKVDVEVLKFIQEENLKLLMEKFHAEGTDRLKANQTFEARGVKETVYSLGYKRYLKHKPVVEKFEMK